MSVPEQTPVSSYTGNGVATVFAYQFLVTLAADLVVTVNGVVKVNGVDYTVSGLAVQSGGNVTFISGAPALNASIVLKRVIALKRDIDYQYAGDFLASTVNADIDRLWLAAQGTLEQANRALRITAGAPAASLELPAATPLGHLRMNAAANAFEYVLASDSGLISSTAYTRTLLDSVDAPAARSVLDIKASTVPNAPAGTIVATTVQAALNELDGEKVALVALAAASGSALIGNADQVVASIAALRALLKTSASKNAFVTGYYAAGDGGGGAYYYDAADTTTADNGGTVIVATDGGRWKLASTTTISVKQFGAKGDGTTNDAVAIQAAITACPLGGVVVFPPSNYLITSRLTVNKGITLQGSTQYQTAIIASASSALLIDLASNVQLKNIEFAAAVRHTTTANTFIGIEVTGATGTRPSKHVYRDVFIDGFSVGYQSAWLWSSVFSNFRTGFCAVGIKATDLSVNNTVNACSFIGAQGLAGSRGIQLNGATNPSEGWMISDTLLDDFEIGIEGIAVTHVYISNCIIDHNRVNGIVIAGSGANFGGNWTIRGNYIAMQGAGGDAAIKSTNAAASSQNRGNIITDNQVLTYAGSTCLRGIYMSGAEAVRNVIQGNTIKLFSTHDIHCVTGPDIVTANVCQSAIALNLNVLGSSTLANNIGVINFVEFAQYQTLGQNKVTWSYTIPTTGTWTQGDIAYKSNAVAGGFIGWTCTAGGTPGTWKTFGAISA